MAEFFIRRPIVAIVIAILIVLLGLAALTGLSFENYPFLAPPIIRITANYPGASATAVEQSVATPIEQEVNGVDRMIYMQSSNTSDGRMLLDVNFQVGVNQDTANVLTQNRVASAQARLPQEVAAQGVIIKKQSPSILLVVDVAGNVALKPVKLDERVDDFYIVTAGLAPGEHVIVDGVQKVRPGMQVKAELRPAAPPAGKGGG